MKGERDSMQRVNLPSVHSTISTCGSIALCQDRLPFIYFCMDYVIEISRSEKESIKCILENFDIYSGQ